MKIFFSVPPYASLSDKTRYIETYYFLLNVRRTYVPLNERLEISLKLLSTWKKNKKELKSDDGLNAFLCVFHDFVQEKNYEEAEKYLWLAYKEKEINKKYGENAVVKNLVEFFKLRKRIEDVEEMGEEDIENDADICQKYQRIGNGLFNLKCYEVSFGYYLKALQNIIAENLYERKRILKLLVQCLERFAKSEEDYSTLFKYCDEIYEISQSLNSSDKIEIKLNRAISLTKLDICSFEDKQKTLLDIKNELNEDKLMVKYYTAFINMLKLSNGHEIEIVQMEEELKLCQSRVVDVTEPNVARDASVDQYDELKIHEILSALEEKFATKEKIETMKKKMFKKDSYGFTELHKAVKSRKLDEIQFMIEHCGFKDIIDEADAGGKTPLFHAVMNGENKIAEYLIKCGASVDICTTDKGSKDPPGRTALMEAASLGNAALVRLLLDNGANPLLKDANEKMASFYLSNKLKLCNAALKIGTCLNVSTNNN
uniref:Ankyrin repeat protein n=1 Tax=Panagrolaimus davidi TaxID=227884 RepID=A0A914QGV6_9BILA